MLTHIVFFKLREPTAANAAALCAQLRTLEGQVPSLRALETGADVVRAERSYDVALITRFDDLAGMEAYQVHPFHQGIVSYVRSVTTKSKSVDFVS